MADTDSGVATKFTAQSGDVEGSLRHLTHEELEAYSNGRLAAARLDYCRTHLDSCEACRAELEDLRIFKSEMAGFQSAQQNRRKKRRSLAVPLTASAAAVLVAAAVAAVLWWRHEGPRANKPVVAVAGVQSPAPTPAVAATPVPAVTHVPTGTAAPAGSHALAATAGPAVLGAAPTRVTPPTQAAAPTRAAPPVQATASTRVAPSVPAAASTRVAPSVQAAASTQVAPPVQAAASTRVAPPVQAAASQTTPPAPASLDAGRTPIHDTRLAAEIAAQAEDMRISAAGASAGFVRLGPFGDDSDARPEFSWQPLPGAVHYSVVIVDAGLHRVARSPALRKTVWRPRRPLRRGRTYLWQVTATVHGGKKVVASGPSPTESVLRIAPLKLADAPHP